MYMLRSVRTCASRTSSARLSSSLSIFPAGSKSLGIVSDSCCALEQNQTELPCPTRRPISKFFPQKSRTTGLQGRHHSTRSTPGRNFPTNSTQEPIIHPVFEPTTGTFQYLVADPSSRATVIIDPVLDFEPGTQTITTRTADALLSLVAENGYNVQYILETHAHADHLSAAAYLQRALSKNTERPQIGRPQIGIGKRIGEVQRLFGKRYGVPAKEYEVVFDRLFEDDEVFHVGALEVKAIHLPGHTPDHMGYKVGNNVFCGDSLFNADIGTARTDFPGGSAKALWQSSQKLLALPEETMIWTGHDYPPEGRVEPVPYMTVKQHREVNRHVGTGVDESGFVRMREERDGKLGAPRLLHQSLQINVRGGKLPLPDEGGRRMLRTPLKLTDVDSW